MNSSFLPREDKKQTDKQKKWMMIIVTAARSRGSRLGLCCFVCSHAFTFPGFKSISRGGGERASVENKQWPLYRSSSATRPARNKSRLAKLAAAGPGRGHWLLAVFQPAG